MALETNQGQCHAQSHLSLPAHTHCYHITPGCPWVPNNCLPAGACMRQPHRGSQKLSMWAGKVLFSFAPGRWNGGPDLA